MYHVPTIVVPLLPKLSAWLVRDSWLDLHLALILADVDPTQGQGKFTSSLNDDDWFYFLDNSALQGLQAQARKRILARYAMIFGEIASGELVYEYRKKCYRGQQPRTVHHLATTQIRTWLEKRGVTLGLLPSTLQWFVPTRSDHPVREPTGLTKTIQNSTPQGSPSRRVESSWNGTFASLLVELPNYERLVIKLAEAAGKAKAITPIAPPSPSLPVDPRLAAKFAACARAVAEETIERSKSTGEDTRFARAILAQLDQDVPSGPADGVATLLLTPPSATPVAPTDAAQTVPLLVEGLRGLVPEAILPRQASKSSLSHAGARLGVEPLRRLYEQLARPVATAETKGAFYKGLRLVAINGTTLDVADTLDHEATFGRPSAS